MSDTVPLQCVLLFIQSRLRQRLLYNLSRPGRVQDVSKLIKSQGRQFRPWDYCLRGMWFYMTLRRVIYLIKYNRVLSYSIPTDCLYVIDMICIAIESYLLYRYTNGFCGLTPLWLGNRPFSLARYKLVSTR